MVHRCCISSCGMNVRVAEAKGLTYHCFPLKQPLRDKWVQAVLPHVDKPDGFKIAQGYTRICSRHFRRKDYSLDRKRARLNTSAIPSVFHTKPSAPLSTESLAENTQPICQDPPVPKFFMNIEKNPPAFVLGSAAISNNDSILLSFTESNKIDCFKESPANKRTETDAIVRNKTSHHKRRRSNRTPTVRSTKSHKTSDDLNIEGVGEALAEINLSTLMGGFTENGNGRKKTSEDLSLDISFDEGDNRSSPKLRKSESEENEILQSTLTLSIGSSKSDEQELLQSIKAVNIRGPERGGLETHSPTLGVEMERKESHFQIDFGEDSLDTLFSGVSVLSGLELEDSSLLPDLTPFNSQDLLDAIRETTNGFPSSDEIDQLACDLNSSFLDNEDLKTNESDLREIRISEMDLPSTFTSDRSIGLGNDMISQLSDITFEPAAKVPKQPDTQLGERSEHREVETVFPETPKRKISPPPPPTPVSTSSSPELPKPAPPKAKGTKKPGVKNNTNCTGRFSAERFRESDKDIGYYTGFSTYKEFEDFYYSLEGHAEKLKVTDIMYGAASLLQTSYDSQQDSSTDEPGSISYVDDGRRLSQGRSMIRIDELFMTLVRLKRKLPEKVLGHMFCVSQSTVSRTVRAWTVLLSKIVEMMPSKSTSPKYHKSNSTPNLNTEENNYAMPKTCYAIPDSVLKLFNSELARSIASSGNSRKTSSSTCTSTSRSKRPKKEKMSGSSVETSNSLPPPDSGDNLSVTDESNPSPEMSISTLEINTLTDGDNVLILHDQGPCEVSCVEEVVTTDYTILAPV